MIHIDRTQADIPVILTDMWPGSRGGIRETEDAIDHYMTNPPKQKAFNFQVYRNLLIKEALLIITHKKCAYCESPIGPTQPVDVEHFRPKSIYYWLAADWDNLLPSCIDCNRSRKQKVPGQNERVLLGKKDQFPLRKMATDEDEETTESRRLKPHETNANQEPRLLLDPCLDDPERHLDFLGEGGLVHANLLDVNGNPDPLGTPSDMGKESIEVYALQREGLVFARYEKLHRLIGQIKRLFEAMEVYAADNTQANLDKVQLEMVDTNNLCSSMEAYAGMCRQYRGEFIEALKRKENFDEAVESIPGAKKVILDAEARLKAGSDEADKMLVELGLL